MSDARHPESQQQVPAASARPGWNLYLLGWGLIFLLLHATFFAVLVAADTYYTWQENKVGFALQSLEKIVLALRIGYGIAFALLLVAIGYCVAARATPAILAAAILIVTPSLIPPITFAPNHLEKMQEEAMRHLRLQRGQQAPRRQANERRTSGGFVADVRALLVVLALLLFLAYASFQLQRPTLGSWFASLAAFAAVFLIVSPILDSVAARIVPPAPRLPSQDSDGLMGSLVAICFIIYLILIACLASTVRLLQSAIQPKSPCEISQRLR